MPRKQVWKRFRNHLMRSPWDTLPLNVAVNTMIETPAVLRGLCECANVRPVMDI